MNTLVFRPLQPADYPEFIRQIQPAFALAVSEEFDENETEDSEVITAEEVMQSLTVEGAEVFFVQENGETVGGFAVVIHPDTQRNSLDLLYIQPQHHGKGLGRRVWQMIEARYPETKVWETHTPYFEKRNIHFYVNKCGFSIVEFFNARHPEPDNNGETLAGRMPDGECFFRFEKQMNAC